MRALSAVIGLAAVFNVFGLSFLKKQQGAPSSANGRRAVVSLYYGTSSPALLNLRTLMSSARRHGWHADRLVMVPKGDPALEFRSLLESDGVHVVEVPVVNLSSATQGVGGHVTARWSKVFTKFMALNLTAYDRILLIDNDAYFAGKGSLDEIFEECGRHEVCLAEDFMPEQSIDDCPDNPSLCRMLNTGVMVLTPSPERLHDILEEAGKDSRAYHYPDQQFLSRYLRTKNVSWSTLDPAWNCCGYAPPADPESRPWVGHLCGGETKAHTSKFCTEQQNCPEKLRAWQQEALAMDPCLSRQTQAECDGRAGCGWCNTYCMDRRVDCTNITFHDNPETWGQGGFR